MQPAYGFGNKQEEQVMECGGKREGLGDPQLCAWEDAREQQ